MTYSFLHFRAGTGAPPLRFYPRIFVLAFIGQAIVSAFSRYSRACTNDSQASKLDAVMLSSDRHDEADEPSKKGFNFPNIGSNFSNLNADKRQLL